jgi:SAM-dependent methyltransferase
MKQKLNAIWFCRNRQYRNIFFQDLKSPSNRTGLFFSNFFESSRLSIANCAMTSLFKDYFSQKNDEYRKFRPTYPAELVAYLTGLSPRREIAWDCATGNGQAALGLADFFCRVFATDASISQVAYATPKANVSYCVCLAEKSCFRHGSLDLITVGQAIHCFDFVSFFEEVNRVLATDGILAVWCYGLGSIEPEIDEIIRFFYHSVVNPFWPPERKYIEENYRTVPFPLNEITPPSFCMQGTWNLYELTGYLNTWSAVKRYRKCRLEDPLDFVMPRLSAAWGEPERKKTITWPISLRVGRKK